ncbi:MAG: heavy-metal-associated domain-containing protein [Coriobacteriia bacterium]|nr:heavy-metal-associated domain-containing protein [Coriobacteriia bacterium]
MSTTTLKIGKMNCEHCASSVRKALETLPSVEKVDVSLKKAEAKVKSSAPLDLESASKVVEEAGFVVEGVK